MTTVPIINKLTLPKLLGLIVVFGLSITYLQVQEHPERRVLIQKNVYSSTTWNVRYTQPREQEDFEVIQEHPVPRVLAAPRVIAGNSPFPSILFELPDHNVTVFSAVGRNSSRNSGWENIILNAWEGKTHVNDTYDCCLYYDTGDVVKTAVSKKNHWLQCKKVHYIAVQITCPSVLHGGHVKPIGVTLVPSNVTCSYRRRYRIPVYLPLKQRDYTTAICAKIAYGSVSPRRLIEWYEVQRQLGVDKIVTYSYNLTREALNVLEHYQASGLVDLVPYSYPHTRELPRTVGDKTGQVFNDEQVAAFDCVERLTGYQFVGLIDHDEFLVPTPDLLTKWRQLFNILLKKEPTASGFSFRTELFVLDWKESENISSVGSVATFTNRTRPMWDRRKNIFLPERVVPGSVWTHNYTDALGYKKFLVSSGFAAVKHFRSCRKEWLEARGCFRRRRYQDLHVAKLVEKVRDRIQRTEQQLLT